MVTRQMICQSCVDGRESECWGLNKDKTWCDSQHYPIDTVILQAQFCKHLRATNTYCPTCGSTFSDAQKDRGRPEPVNADEQPLDFGYLSLPKETQRDIEDNFVTGDDAVTGKPGQKRFTLDKLKASRSLPKRNSQT